MTAGDPLDQRIITRIRNHPVVAAVVVFGTIVIAIANLTDATTKIIALFTGVSEPEIRSVVIDESPDQYRLSVTVLNPTSTPLLLTGVRVFEDISQINNTDPNIATLCAADYTLYFGSQVTIESQTRGQLSYVAKIKNEERTTYDREAHGLLSRNCGSSDQSFALWSDIALEAKASAYTTIDIHVPKSFRVDVPLYEARRSTSDAARMDKDNPVMSDEKNQLQPDTDANYSKLEKTITLDAIHFRDAASLPAWAKHTLRIDFQSDRHAELSFTKDLLSAPAAKRIDVPVK